MNDVKSLGEQLSDSASEFWSTVGSYLPKIVSALILLIVALLAAKLAQYIVVKGLRLLGVDKLRNNKTVAKTLRTAELNIDFVSIAGRIVFWVVIVIFALTIADVLQLAAMRDVIREFVAYLPNVLAAAVVLTITVAGARIVRDVVKASLARMQVDYASNVASLTFYVLFIFGTVMALDQLGFDTTILRANITVIIGGIMLALALAFGLGGRDTAGRMVEDAYKHLSKRSNKR